MLLSFFTGAAASEVRVTVKGKMHMKQIYTKCVLITHLALILLPAFSAAVFAETEEKLTHSEEVIVTSGIAPVTFDDGARDVAIITA